MIFGPTNPEIQITPDQVWHYNNPQVHTTWQFTLRISVWYVGTCLQTLYHKFEFACDVSPSGGVFLINLVQPINLFISSTDQLYGPITTLEHNGYVVTKLPFANLADVQGFLGLAGYMCIWMKNYSAITCPLINLTCKGVTFVWEEQQADTMQHLKDAIVNSSTFISINCSTNHPIFFSC
jgi:hypothetical protein